jgi:ABC-type polysaccharide/polyol phosphate transport system ATPase subunit
VSDIVISVEQLGKKYWITHRGETAPYKTLRDTITLKARHAVNGWRVQNGANRAQGQTREEFWALKDVSFEVRQGDVLGIIGRNGAGKSTLLKILSRITEPTSGRVRIRGRVASLLEVGTGFHPELTGRENINLNGAILGMGKAEIRRKFDEIVAFSEVEKFLDTPVKRYSSGMYVRLAFAVAAHLEPEILIVDEVLAVGDVKFQAKCLGKIKNVASGGRTVLFVSHNLGAVLTLTSSCAYLEKGILKFVGATNEAIKRYTEAEENDDLIYVNKELPKTAKPRIVSVELRTTFPNNLQMNNSPLDVVVTLHTPRPVMGACVSVQIYDANQTNYALLSIQDIDVPLCRQPGTYVLKGHIPKLRLYMGTYRLRVFFSEPPGGETFQTISGICPFEVKMKENSRLFQWWPNECTYVEDYQWDVVQAL